MISLVTFVTQHQLILCMFSQYHVFLLPFKEGPIFCLVIIKTKEKKGKENESAKTHRNHGMGRPPNKNGQYGSQSGKSFFKLKIKIWRAPTAEEYDAESLAIEDSVQHVKQKVLEKASLEQLDALEDVEDEKILEALRFGLRV